MGNADENWYRIGLIACDLFGSGGYIGLKQPVFIIRAGRFPHPTGNE